MRVINIWVEVPGGKELLGSYEADNEYEALMRYLDDEPSSLHEMQIFRRADGSKGYSLSGSEISFT
jgi:hypothetical protein